MDKYTLTVEAGQWLPKDEEAAGKLIARLMAAGYRPAVVQDPDGALVLQIGTSSILFGGAGTFRVLPQEWVVIGLDNVTRYTPENFTRRFTLVPRYQTGKV